MQPKAPTIINGIAHWACSRCSRVLPPESFYKDKRSPNGLKAQCKECHTEGSIRTRDKENHRVKRRESARKRFLEDPEAFREKWRKRPRKVGPKVDARQIERWLVGHASELAMAGIDPCTLRAQAQENQMRLATVARTAIGAWLDGIEASV